MLGFVSPNNLPLSETNRQAITVGDVIKFMYEIGFNYAKYKFSEKITADNLLKIKKMCMLLITEVDQNEYKIKLKDLYPIRAQKSNSSQNQAANKKLFNDATYYYLKSVNPNNVAKSFWKILNESISNGGYGLTQKLNEVKINETIANQNWKLKVVPYMNNRLFNILPGISYMKTTRNLAGYGGFYHLREILKGTKGDVAKMAKNYPTTIKNFIFPLIINYSAATIKNVIANSLEIKTTDPKVSSIYNGLVQIAVKGLQSYFGDKAIMGATQYFEKGTLPTGFKWPDVKDHQLMIAFAQSLGKGTVKIDVLLNRLRALKTKETQTVGWGG